MSVENDENRISINPFMCGDSQQKKREKERDRETKSMGSNSSNLSESVISLVYIHMLFLEYLNLDFKSVPIQCSKTDIVGVEYILFYGLRAHQRFAFYI